MTKLFPFDLTPQKRYLLEQVHGKILRRSLQTNDLKLTLLYLRELRLDDWIWEVASSIAHQRRDQGMLWSWALNVWATHLYYDNYKTGDPDIDCLPVDVYNTIRHWIEDIEEWQLQKDFSDIFQNGTTKDELLATLEHLYLPVSNSKKGDPAFMRLASRKGIPLDDIAIIKALVTGCEHLALSIPGTPLKDLVDAIENAFRHLKITKRRFDESDRAYLQLHLLVSFHNTLIEIRPEVYKQLTNQPPPSREAMLSVSAMESTLGVDIAFYYRTKEGHLEQDNLYSPDRFERFRFPLIQTNLEEKNYLLESDMDIRCCLYNHPLEVRKHDGNDVIVALERTNAQYRPTRSRYSTRET